MRPRRALVVAYYFPPLGGGGVARTLKLVRALAEAGWRTLVVTVDDAQWTRAPELLHEVPAATQVWRVLNPDWGRVAARGGSTPGPGRGRGRLWRWLVPDLHVGWSALAAAIASGVAAARAADVVYTTAPPYSAHLAGLAARSFGLPWVADFRDAWTDNHDRQGFPAWRHRLELGLERAVLRRADRVVFSSDGARERAVARMPELAARAQTVLTGFDPCVFAVGAPPQCGRLELVHAGSALLDGRGDTLARLLAALAAWARRRPEVTGSVRVRFIGGEPAIAERLERAGVAAWVGVEPGVPRERVGARLAAAHACLHLAPPGPLGGDNVSGKLFDAAGAGRPILSLVREGAVAQLVRGLGLGVVVAPEDESALLATLEAWRAAALRCEPVATVSAAGRASLSAERTIPRLVAELEAAAEGSRQQKGRARRAVTATQ
ncbi:MAG TPA: glycosyltransferase [Myxococcota bacterium]|nr:glycosyltransferase [Myxococcota bacterium]